MKENVQEEKKESVLKVYPKGIDEETFTPQVKVGDDWLNIELIQDAKHLKVDIIEMFREMMEDGEITQRTFYEIQKIDKIGHLQWMLKNWPKDAGVRLKDGKFDRWLGFVQGALWAMDLKDIDTFRDDTRQGINNAYDKLKKYLEVE